MTNDETGRVVVHQYHGIPSYDDHVASVLCNKVTKDKGLHVCCHM
jgi:hypothetical protein